MFINAKSALLLTLASSVVASGIVLAVQPKTKLQDPWEQLSPGFNGSMRTLGYASENNGISTTAGTLVIGGDEGGAYRSLDCGDTWETVNGGPAFTEGINGG